MDESKPTVALAFLEIPRQTCIGCSEFLHERGMIVVTAETKIPVMVYDGEPPKAEEMQHVIRHYRLAPGVSLADCQEAVRHRHRGPRPWGMD